MTFNVTLEMLVNIQNSVNDILQLTKPKELGGKESLLFISQNSVEGFFNEWEKEYKKLGSPILGSQILDQRDEALNEAGAKFERFLSAPSIEALSLLGAFGGRMRRKALGGEFGGVVVRALDRRTIEKLRVASLKHIRKWKGYIE